MSDAFVNPDSQREGFGRGPHQRPSAHGDLRRVAALAEAQDGPEYDIELRYAGQEAERQFTVREVVVKGDPEGRTAFGIRHRDGGWWSVRYQTREAAELIHDAVLLMWLETEGGLLLLDAFHETTEDNHADH